MTKAFCAVPVRTMRLPKVALVLKKPAAWTLPALSMDRALPTSSPVPPAFMTQTRRPALFSFQMNASLLEAVISRSRRPGWKSTLPWKTPET
jgi:hypothetical protein